MLHVFKLRKNSKGDPASVDQVPCKAHASFFKNVNKYLAAHAVEDAYNIFIPHAHYSGKDRKAENFLYQEIVAFDIDHIDVERVSEYPKIISLALGIEVEKCAAICSGSGIHFVVYPSGFKITKTEDFKTLLPYYKAWCLEIGKALKEAGLVGEVDEQYFQPSRSIRVPNTLNCKPAGSTPKDCAKKTEVKFIEGLDNLEAQLFLFSEITPVKDDKEKEYLRKGSYGKPDVEYIMSECTFLKEVKNNADKVSEPQWFEAVNIVSHFQDDFKTAHEISKGHPGYIAEETQEKAERAHYSYGPSLCSSVEQKVWDKCKECPHYGKVRSPIQLKSKEHVSTEACGFTVMVKGKPVRQYEDLRRHFAKEQNYIVFDDNSEIFVFDGKKYSSFSEVRLRDYAQEHLNPICEKDSERKEFASQVKSRNIVSRASFEAPTNCVNLLNGVLDIRSGVLTPHSPNFFFTYVLPYNYDEKAECPTWDQFMQNISLGRRQIIDCLEEFIGYSILGGEYSINKMLIMAGDGSNGKTTLINVIKKIIGLDNCSFVPASKYGNNFYLANLYGKLANISEETGSNGLKDIEVIKLLTGDGTLEVDRKFSQPFNFVNKAKIIMSYNKVPYLPEGTLGAKRRLMIVPFDLNLEEEKDKKISDIQGKLEAELSGILNRCLMALNRLLKNGEFTEIEETQERLKEMMTTSDAVFELWEDYIDVTGNLEDTLMLKDLWNLYETDVDPSGGGGERRTTQRTFYTRLRNIGTKKKGVSISNVFIGEKRERAMHGVRLKNTAQAQY